MKVVVIESNTFLDQKIERVLTSNGIALDFTSKLNQAMLKMYDAVIFSYKNTIPALPKVIERICLEKKILVVYINNVPSIGQFFSVLNDHYFRMVNDLTIEIELPLIIHSSSKYIRELSYLEQVNKELKLELETLKLTNKAKSILMKKGLNEAESHKFIQKRSMEMRVDKKTLVNLIIQNEIDI